MTVAASLSSWFISLRNLVRQFVMANVNTVYRVKAPSVTATKLDPNFMPKMEQTRPISRTVGTTLNSNDDSTNEIPL
jgi:hypothetical protein